MQWSEIRYTIERTKKEFSYDHHGKVIYLCERFNKKGEPLSFGSVAQLLEKNGEIITERHYSIDNRASVMDELEKLAEGKTIKSVDAITGKATFA